MQKRPKNNKNKNEWICKMENAQSVKNTMEYENCAPLMWYNVNT